MGLVYQGDRRIIRKYVGGGCSTLNYCDNASYRMPDRCTEWTYGGKDKNSAIHGYLNYTDVFRCGGLVYYPVTEYHRNPFLVQRNRFGRNWHDTLFLAGYYSIVNHYAFYSVKDHKRPLYLFHRGQYKVSKGLWGTDSKNYSICLCHQRILCSCRFNTIYWKINDGAADSWRCNADGCNCCNCYRRNQHVRR